MKFRSSLLSLSLALSLTSAALAVCSPETPILKIDGRTITYSYFRYVESTIPQWAMERYYPGIEGKRKLLRKLLERQLILQYYEDKGFFKRPEIKEHISRFKVETLASLYLSRHLKSPEVSEREIEEVIKRYYRGKKITPILRRSIKINLQAQKLASEREEIISSLLSRLKVENLTPESPSDVVAVYGGKKITFSDIKPLIQGKVTPFRVKKALQTYVLYLNALKEGLDRSTNFKNQLLAFKENLAASAFERYVLSRVKVTDGEIREYYSKHREEFKTPASARVLIFSFFSEERAKKALKALEKGEKPKKAVPRDIFPTGKVWTVLSTERNNPVAMLIFSSKKRFYLLNMPDGRTLLIVVEKRKPSRYAPLADVYSDIKSKLLKEKARKIVDREVSYLKKRYGARILPAFNSCFGKEESR